MTARRCAYLTMENLDGWSIDAELGFAPLEAMGWTVDALPWRSENVDWNAFDAVYIGTPWDYPEDPDRFLEVLASIDRSRAVLVNDMALVTWSLPKTYLRDLEKMGVDIVPSIWGERYEAGMLRKALDRFGADKVIIKPVVSTNATDTFLIERKDFDSTEARLSGTFSNVACVIQPFMSDIQSEGEYSLFYFNRQFSHAILKTPKSGDFRVQEEFGANIVAVDPGPALRETSDRILQLIEPMPVYARADLVRGAGDRFYLMELELVEPSMYLRMDALAPERFAKAFDDYFTQVSGK